MYDLITIGSATLDIVVKSKSFQLMPSGNDGIALCEKYGSKMDINELRMISGGGGTNVAVGGSRLGLKTAVVCEVGKDFPAQMVFDELKREHVSTDFIVAERLEETAVSVLLVAGEGGRTALTHRGAASMLESRDMPWNQLPHTRWIHMGSLGGQKQLLFDLFEFFKTHNMGVSWTPSKSDLALFTKGQLLPEIIVCDVLLLNNEEWEELSSIHSSLLSTISVIAITNGKHGGRVIVEKDEETTYTIEKVDTVEETGAGDAFASGFIAALLYGKSLEGCITWGKRNAASVVQHLGAKKGLLRREEIEKDIITK